MSQAYMQVGSVDLKSPGASALKPNDTSSFKQVSFPKPFPANSKVVVVPMTQTFHGPDTPGVRIDEVTPRGFKIRINELVHSADGNENLALSNGTHVSETIGWAAFTEGDTLDNHGHDQLWHGTLEAKNESGVPTGVTLQEGDVVSITVTGSASVTSTTFPGSFGPDGDPANTEGSNTLLPSANVGAVLMKIGNGPYRLVGSEWSGAVEEGGEIAFFYNDTPGWFKDDTGSFEITLSK